MMDQADGLIIDGNKNRLLDWIRSNFSNIPVNLTADRILHAEIEDGKLILAIN